jgi:hypothetical protein
MGTQAHELKINNWVHLKDKGYYQIDSGHDIDEISTHEGTDYCTPIPLTEDILIKAGFYLDAGKYWKDLNFRKSKLCYFNGMLTIMQSVDVIILRTPEMQPTIYLHQLQNLYFALTGTELIVNL